MSCDCTTNPTWTSTAGARLARGLLTMAAIGAAAMLLWRPGGARTRPTTDRGTGPGASGGGCPARRHTPTLGRRPAGDCRRTSRQPDREVATLVKLTRVLLLGPCAS